MSGVIWVARAFSIFKLIFLTHVALASITYAAAANEQVTAGEQSYEARALVRAKNRVEYRNEIIAPLKKTPFLEGQQFNQGDTLIEFNCDRYKAEEKAAKASANAAAIEYNTKRRLYKYQAAGKNEVSLAAAQSAEAQAQLQAQKVRNQSCEFKAPFDGRVVKLNAKPHEFPPNDKPLIVVINDTALELEMVVSSKWLRWLKPNAVFEVEIDETGTVGSGKVDRIAAEVDPVSQTVKLIATFTQKPDSVLAGMSGAVKFNQLTH